MKADAVTSLGQRISELQTGGGRWVLRLSLSLPHHHQITPHPGLKLTLTNTLLSTSPSPPRYSAALVIYLSGKTGGFKISNINILKAVLQTAAAFATHSGPLKDKGLGAADEPFSRPAAWSLLKQLADKGLSDKKAKDATGALLTAMAGSAGLQPAFVVRKHIRQHSNSIYIMH